MELTCDVIRDLLPLYVEDIASSDTRILVEEHILSCPNCKNELDGMSMSEKFPPDIETRPIIHLKKKLQTRKILTIIFSVLLTLLAAVVAIAFLTTPNYLPYSEDLVSLSKNEAGTIIATFSDEVSGYVIFQSDYENGLGNVYSITTWNDPWNQYIIKSSAKKTVINPNNEDVASIYYYTTDGSKDRVIFGKDIYASGGSYSLPRLVLAYYVLIAMVLFAIFVITWLVFRKNALVKNISEKAALLPLSYLIGHFCIKGFTTTSYSASRDFFAILLAMFPIYGLLLLTNNLYRKHIRKQQVYGAE